MELSAGAHTLKDLATTNIILGKNGTGKSQLLRTFDANLRQEGDKYVVTYVSPERGGTFAFDAGIQNNLQTNDSWGTNVRRKNRVDNFRQITFAEFQILETVVLRRIERMSPEERTKDPATFDTTVELINRLLDNVKLARVATGFQIQARDSTERREVDTLSSGESELLAVAIQILLLANLSKQPDYRDRQCVLLLDEPDVHLHPDLQQRLMELLVEVTNETKLITIIATHSTAILGGLSHGKAAVAFMSRGATELTFRPISETLQRVLPIFGAHPLSNVLNQSPLLLVEGDDDVRIWQQAVRSARGRIRFWPCAAGDIQSLHAHEATAAEVVTAVYDNAIAYSLRDRDDQPYEIEDLGPVVRMRLSCRTAENLFLSDDVLASIGLNWGELKERMSSWLESNKTHQDHSAVSAFMEADNRKEATIKDIRNLIVFLTNYKHDWEVAIGKAIAKLHSESPAGSGSLRDFLGPKAMKALLKVQ